MVCLHVWRFKPWTTVWEMCPVTCLHWFCFYFSCLLAQILINVLHCLLLCSIKHPPTLHPPPKIVADSRLMVIYLNIYTSEVRKLSSPLLHHRWNHLNALHCTFQFPELEPGKNRMCVLEPRGTPGRTRSFESQNVSCEKRLRPEKSLCLLL